MTPEEACGLTDQIRDAQDELRTALLEKGLTPDMAESVLRALRDRAGTRSDGGATLRGAPWVER